MRYSRTIATIILATTLIFALIINTAAESVSHDLLIFCASLYYKPNESEASGGYDNVEATDYTNYVEIKCPNEFGDWDNYDLHSVGILMQPYEGEIELERGYIYTFNFTFRMNNLEIDPSEYELRFGICNDQMAETLPLADIVFTHYTVGRFTEFSATCIVNVEQEINYSFLGQNDELFYYLEIIGYWTGVLTIRSYTQTVKKAVGQEAYYQASLDAINNLPQSEYDYIYNSMPDTEGESQVLIGQLNDIYDEFNPWLNRINTLFQSDVSRPCVYIPEVVIPILDIQLLEPQIFYIDDYLNRMNPDILPKIEIVLWFIRFVACVTFCYVTYYKVVRIEWWC